MKAWILMSAIAMVAAPAAAQTVDVGTGDWSAIPPLQKTGQYRMGDAQMDRIEAIAAERACRVPGLDRAAVNIRVPFVVRFDGDAIGQVVLRDLGCPQLETVLGAAILQLADAGEYQRPGPSASGWYRGEISFANQ